jgi:hypothetical protein
MFSTGACFEYWQYFLGFHFGFTPLFQAKMAWYVDWILALPAKSFFLIPFEGVRSELRRA